MTKRELLEIKKRIDILSSYCDLIIEDYEQHLIPMFTEGLDARLNSVVVAFEHFK